MDFHPRKMEMETQIDLNPSKSTFHSVRPELFIQHFIDASVINMCTIQFCQRQISQEVVPHCLRVSVTDPPPPHASSEAGTG